MHKKGLINDEQKRRLLTPTPEEEGQCPTISFLRWVKMWATCRDVMSAAGMPLHLRRILGGTTLQAAAFPACRLHAAAEADVRAYLGYLRDMEVMSGMLWELTALTGVDQDPLDVTLAFHRAGKDVAAARECLGLPATGVQPLLHGVLFNLYATV